MVKNFKTICIWSARVVMFLCSCGEDVARKLFLIPSIYRHKTGFLRIHLFQTRYYHPSRTSPRHTNMFSPIVEKFRVLFFSTIQTQHNSQLTTYCYLALRGALECDLSWLVMTCPALRQDIGPFEDLSVLTKFTRPTSRSHLFLRLFDKMYRACNADQS